MPYIFNLDSIRNLIKKTGWEKEQRHPRICFSLFLELCTEFETKFCDMAHPDCMSIAENFKHMFSLIAYHVLTDLTRHHPICIGRISIALHFKRQFHFVLTAATAS
jgi:hypothetical protein